MEERKVLEVTFTSTSTGLTALTLASADTEDPNMLSLDSHQYIVYMFVFLNTYTM